MSVNASVSGPAEILGSSLVLCNKVGTLKPQKAAIISTKIMLMPIVIPASIAPFQIITTNATIKPQLKPNKKVVLDSLTKLLKYHFNDGSKELSVLIVKVMDWMLTLSPSPNTNVKKKAITKLSASVASKNPANNAQIVPLATVAISHGNLTHQALAGVAFFISSNLKPMASKT